MNPRTKIWIFRKEPEPITILIRYVIVVSKMPIEAFGIYKRGINYLVPSMNVYVQIISHWKQWRTLKRMKIKVFSTLILLPLFLYLSCNNVRNMFGLLLLCYNTKKVILQWLLRRNVLYLIYNNKICVSVCRVQGNLQYFFYA